MHVLKALAVLTTSIILNSNNIQKETFLYQLTQVHQKNLHDLQRKNFLSTEKLLDDHVSQKLCHVKLNFACLSCTFTNNLQVQIKNIYVISFCLEVTCKYAREI